MKKFILITVLTITAVALGWNYIPTGIREKAAALIGVAVRQDTQGARDILKNTLSIKDETKERAIALQDLKNNLRKIKEGIVNSNAVRKEHASVSASHQNLAELIGSSEKLLEKLEKNNNATGLSDKIIEKIINSTVSHQNIECSVPPAK